MSSNIRFVFLILANMLILSTMLAWLANSGIDVAASSFLDNANNPWFVMDYIFYLIALFVINFLIISLPSSKRRSILKIIDSINIKAKSKDVRQRSRHKPA
jgi:uncharacterized protein YacL